MTTCSRNLTGFNRAVVDGGVLIILVFHPYTFLHDEWRWMTWYFVTTKQGKNISWFRLRLFSYKFCWKPCQLRPQSRCHCCVHQVAIWSLSHFRYIPLCFWYVLLRAFERCLQRPTVIISSRDNFWRKRLFKGSVFTAFAVWKYFSCIKKQLILCFDETKMDLKPLIMLF